jgi:glutathione S-transferase
MRTPDGTVVPETIAIAEELATRHPEAGIWPSDPHARATARVLAAEMHAGFTALRNHCPMNLRVSYTDCQPTPEVLADLKRLETLWSWARRHHEIRTPWLCGAYSAADAFFAPVASPHRHLQPARRPDAMVYVNAHLAHPSFRRWRAMGLVDGADQDFYRRDYPRRDWPGPVPLPAKGGRLRRHGANSACPYSGKPVTHALELYGRRFGFCNAFCRDKTAGRCRSLAEVHDPLPIVNHSALPVNQGESGGAACDSFTNDQRATDVRLPRPARTKPSLIFLLGQISPPEARPSRCAPSARGETKGLRGTRSIQ